MISVKREINSLEKPGQASVEPINKIYKIKEQENVGESKKEKDAREYIRTEKKDSITPPLALGFNTSDSRRTITIASPSSTGVS